MSARLPAAGALIAEIGSITEAAARLRRMFDDSFAAPPPGAPEHQEDFIAIRVGASPCALRLAEIASLHMDLPILPVPTPRPDLLGIVALRGVLAPLYDLAALLHRAQPTRPRWMIFVRSPELVGFAFESFESHLRVAQSACVAMPGQALDEHGGQGQREAGDAGKVMRHVSGAVQAGSVLRPIIQLSSLVEMLKGENS